MKKLFRILIVSLVIIFATNNIFAAADTNVTKESHVWIKNNSDYPLNIFVERIETLIPDSSINYFLRQNDYFIIIKKFGIEIRVIFSNREFYFLPG